MKRAPRSRQRHDLYAKYHDYDSEISDLLGECGLKGDWADHRECHIGGDFLLIYQVEGNSVVFVRAGTHAELFE